MICPCIIQVMEFLSISQVQAIVNHSPSCYVEDEIVPEVESSTIDETKDQEIPDLVEADEITTTKNPMEYIDHMFMVCGFVRLSENQSITNNSISRMYSSRTGLCVSLKCGIAYKCCFLYDNKVNYTYPATQELLDYVSSFEEDIGFVDTFKLIEPSKIFPESFEIVVFKQDSKPLSEHTLNLFEKKFLNCKNTSVSASGSTIIITYAPVCIEENLVSIESFVKFLNPSW